MLRENRAILDGAILVARGTGADAVLLAVALDEESAYLRTALADSTRVITATSVTSAAGIQEDDFVTLPQVRLRRRGRAKVALLEGLASGLIRAGERVVVISGGAGAGGASLDTVAVVELTGGDELLAGHESATLDAIAHVADPTIFDTLVGLCIELSRHGREGRAVGFLATLGDHEEVLARSHPLVLNPFEGHGAGERCILFPVARRAIREFSGIDGAFIVRSDGFIVSAGRYLEEAPVDDAVPPGLGARHRAAAGITRATRCVAFVVSETSGELRIFSGGRLLMTLAPDD